MDVTHIMGPSEGLKVSATPNEGHGAHDHDGEHDDEDDPGRVGDTGHETEDTRTPGLLFSDVMKSYYNTLKISYSEQGVLSDSGQCFYDNKKKKLESDVTLMSGILKCLYGPPCREIIKLLKVSKRKSYTGKSRKS